MIQAKMGDKVKVEIEGMLDDGTVVEAKEDKEPMVFVLGKNMVIARVEEAIIGMKEGEAKTIKVPPEETHGAYREDMVFDMDKSKFPSELELRQGMRFEIPTAKGKLPATIKKIEDDSITMDANPPLAGKTLNLTITLREISQP